MAHVQPENGRRGEEVQAGKQHADGDPDPQNQLASEPAQASVGAQNYFQKACPRREVARWQVGGKERLKRVFTLLGTTLR